MNKVELQFKTLPGGSYDDTFTTMKLYQNFGIAERTSKIIFNGVEVAAGYYDTCGESFKLYTSLVSGDLEKIKKSLPKGVESTEVLDLENSIFRAYKGLHKIELSSEYLDSLTDSLVQKKVMNK